jgi:hypothetical protein
VLVKYDDAKKVDIDLVAHRVNSSLSQDIGRLKEQLKMANMMFAD